MPRIVLQPKFQPETVTETFDFISQLAVGETILTQVVTAGVLSGSDSNPAAIISGSAAVANVTQVLQKITAGVLGVIYELVCQITTSLGNSLIISASLAIVPVTP